MITASVKEKLLEQLNTLPSDMQHRVLDFAQALALSMPRGVPGERLIDFAGTIPACDLETMRLAIEAGCEQIDDEW